ncbi:uncharacterized protein LOC133185804 [Saccostrea echinata]|uniref:uncharacterized protein LOC133185804 n=1 Tax=Saccostrea echinata TaxID=191078 RepID=UPI002A80A684|nr:uncharacterized protein LOC133185804 [Saccostrea echinata]
MLAQKMMRIPAEATRKIMRSTLSLTYTLKKPNTNEYSSRSADEKRLYWNDQDQSGNKSVYCMQFDVSGLTENELSTFTKTLHNDVSSMKPDIVYIQQTKEGIYSEEIGLGMKRLGYDGYIQKVTPELKQATFFRSKLLHGLQSSPNVLNTTTTG